MDLRKLDQTKDGSQFNPLIFKILKNAIWIGVKVIVKCAS